MNSVGLPKSLPVFLALLLAATVVPVCAGAREQPPAPAAAAAPGAPATAEAPVAPPRAPRADAAATQALLDAIRKLDIATAFSARTESQAVIRDDKLDVRWSLTGDLAWRNDFSYEFHLAPKGSGERVVHGLSTGAQRWLAFTDEGRFATRSMPHLDASLTAVFAGCAGEHFLFNSLHRMAQILAASNPFVPAKQPVPVPAPGAVASLTPPPFTAEALADPVNAVWGACVVAVEPATGSVQKFAVTIQPDLGDRLLVQFDGRTVTLTADRSKREAARLKGDDTTGAPGIMTYTETWTCANLPAGFQPAWVLPNDVEGKPFKEITLNAFGRDRAADRLVGQPAPALVVDSYPPVTAVTLGAGLPGGWSALPGVIAPRVVPGFAPLPTTGPKEIDWSEEPAKAAKIAAHPITLGDLQKRFPNRPVAVAFLALWSTEAQDALKDLAALQVSNPPLLLICHENAQTFVDELARKGMAVSVCRDPQGRNGVRFGVDAYPTIFVIAPDRTIQNVLRGWTAASARTLQDLLKLP